MLNGSKKLGHKNIRRTMSEEPHKQPLRLAVGTEFEQTALQIDGFLTLVSNEPGEYVCLLDGTLYSNVPDLIVKEMLTKALRNWE
jgi:hypothetical protein